MAKITLEWIEVTNDRLKKTISDREERHSALISEWVSQYKNSSVDSEYAEACSRIHDWFETRTAISREYLGWMFVGSFYFAASFWSVCIPVICGTFKVDIFNSLDTMPEKGKQMLTSNQTLCEEYARLWVDCFDYGYEIEKLCGFEDEDVSLTFSQSLFRSSEKHLTAAVSMMNHHRRPNFKAIEDSRMAIEVLLKAYLAEKTGLTEEIAKKEIGHNIHEALQRCVRAGLTDLVSIGSRLVVFPDIKARYSGYEGTFGEIWSAYSIAQFVAASVTRSLTGRDTRPNITLTRNGQKVN
ncbi:MAG: hypothetical protein SF097_19685 [Acidobacteriota bacterium]|nr:hypothetical protein [Acidobacteriota bacterium]